MASASGLARTDIEIVDLSLLVGTGLKGIAGFIGITELGITSTPRLVGSWLEFVKYFGGLRADTIFPLLCRRALEAGAKLKVSRAGHYTTIANPSTLVGTKATGIIAETTTAAITAVTMGSGGPFVVTGDVTAFLTAGSTFTVSGSTGNNGTYTVSGTPVFASGHTTITVATGIISATADGVINYATKKVTLVAEGIGAGYDNFTFAIAAAANGDATLVDISITNPLYPDNDQLIKNVNKIPATADITAFNARALHVDINTILFAGELPIGSITLTGGAEVISTIVTADYIGDVGGQNGIFAFDTETDITRIAVPEKAIGLIDSALVDYAASRQDLRAWVRTPVGLDGSTVVDYRECSGAYTGSAIDSMYGTMSTGGLLVIDPLSGNQIEIPEIADVIGLRCSADNNKFEWFSSAGSKRGRIKNALGVVYNFGSPARQTEGDNVDVHGVNVVINHSSFGIVNWGNSSLSKADTLLKHDNICELLVFLHRAIKPLCESELFDPNDTQTWQTIYRKVKQLMDFVAVNRGVQGGEGKGWKYEGDQNVDNVADAVINQPLDIDAGKYVFRLFIKPTPAMKYVGVKVAVTNSSVDFSVFDNAQI